MLSSTKAAEEEAKQNESMQQAPSAPMGPPPTYNEAMHTSAYPPMPVPTQTAPYPATESSMPLPQPTGVNPVCPYPVGNDPSSVRHHSYAQQASAYNGIGFSEQQQYQQPIMNQPGTNSQYVHPQTTYVVLQDDGRNNRRRQDDCMDCMWCCLCCVESCRCIMMCAECCSN